MPCLCIRLVAQRGVGAAIIRAGQLGYATTHVEAVVPGGYLGAHLADGVQVKPVGYDAGTVTAERFVAVHVTATQFARFHAFLRAQLGRPYDRRAIVDFALAAIGVPLRVAPPGAWREPDRWECAALQLAALIHAVIVDGALFADAHHVTPRDLAVLLAGLTRTPVFIAAVA